ncbi:class I SAM-dependent methyltransferase [Actinopolymorpha sp. B17G11]|uniref:class I SAM-dependent methyltransferase n=1 Tax=Actinopolymorpha sp. B17G11 TaxID=3160861 RepID=UPI0032E3D385
MYEDFCRIEETVVSWQELQGKAHGFGYDYDPGSPHLSHLRLKKRLGAEIWSAVDRSFIRKGNCRVLEIGGGHGTITELAVAAGASVTVTEMSEASAVELRKRFAHNDRVRVIHDRLGDEILKPESTFDVVLCVSVLHHIPDYLGYVKSLVDLISPDGDLITFQDPMWYPRRSRRNMAMYWACYFAWRAFQGNLLRGLGTRIRHVRGIRDQRLESDMVEYHVVRQGVDEVALASLVEKQFTSTAVVPYWSTQSGVLQRLGERLSLHSSFALVATGRGGTTVRPSAGESLRSAQRC